MVVQVLNHNTFELHPYDYKQTADTGLEQHVETGGNTLKKRYDVYCQAYLGLLLGSV